MSRSLSFTFRLGDEALPVDVEFTASWEGPNYDGDHGGWIVEDVTILTQEAPYTDVTDKATASELETIREKAAKVAEEDAQPDPDRDRE